MTPGILFHYRLTFLIYVLTCIFCITQALQGSEFFTVVAAVTGVIAIFLGIIVVRSVSKMDINDREESDNS